MKDGNRQNYPSALADVNSRGVQQRAKEAVDWEAGQDILKNKLKSIEEKYALSQKAIPDALNRDLEGGRRKQKQQSKTLSKKGQRENATKTELAKLKLELEVAQRETGRVKAALGDLGSVRSVTVRAPGTTSFFYKLSTSRTSRKSILRHKNKASASAQKAQSKLEAELRNLELECSESELGWTGCSTTELQPA